MTKWEILKALDNMSQGDNLAGGYIRLILTVINRHPEHLDRLAALKPATPQEIYKICLNGW